MIEYNIINPSDACTLKSETLIDAAIAAILVGGGQYPLEPINAPEGTEGVPIFMFGGLQEWWNKRFDISIDEALQQRRESVATVLESVTLKGERSSMNDIQGRARRQAAWVRGESKTVEKAPQQVFFS